MRLGSFARFLVLSHGARMCSSEYKQARPKGQRALEWGGTNGALKLASDTHTPQCSSVPALSFDPFQQRVAESGEE